MNQRRAGLRLGLLIPMAAGLLLAQAPTANPLSLTFTYLSGDTLPAP